ncbi:MAG: hypothetical protein ACRDVP_12665 [Acidimicrobiales bacterium]
MSDAVISGGRDYTQLASYRQCISRLVSAWPSFTARRSQRLRQGLFDAPVEKIAENILEDLFTQVLDWNLADVNLQIGRAEIVLSELGIKRLVLEVKRPGSLAWHRNSVSQALDQPVLYAAQQQVTAVAVSDGQMLYAADIAHGGLRDRVFTSLDGTDPPLDLWWISVHGIYRPCPPASAPLPSAAQHDDPAAALDQRLGEVLHHKYHLPVRCFAYVQTPDHPQTWKLPYLMADGSPDLKRLPKAIQAILSNYRGTKVTIPREAVAGGSRPPRQDRRVFRQDALPMPPSRRSLQRSSPGARSTGPPARGCCC